MTAASLFLRQKLFHFSISIKINRLGIIPSLTTVPNLPERDRIYTSPYYTMREGFYMIKWKDEYSLGVEQIYEQHRKLFEIAGRALWYN